MKVEISKEQKEALSQKISMCVEFLKKEIQPHLISKDKVVVEINENLELIITNKEIYVKNIQLLDFRFFVLSLSNTFYLEKDRQKVKKYICFVKPDLAVVFLQHWEKTKKHLIDQVFEKNMEVSKLNSFIDNFHL